MEPEEREETAAESHIYPIITISEAPDVKGDEEDAPLNEKTEQVNGLPEEKEEQKESEARAVNEKEAKEEKQPDSPSPPRTPTDIANASQPVTAPAEKESVKEEKKPESPSPPRSPTGSVKTEVPAQEFIRMSDLKEKEESDMQEIQLEEKDEVNPLKFPTKKSVSIMQPEQTKIVKNQLQKEELQSANKPERGPSPLSKKRDSLILLHNSMMQTGRGGSGSASGGGMDIPPRPIIRPRQSTVNSDYDENTPLLYASSLPTIVGEEIERHLPGSSGYSNPNYEDRVPVSTRSEGGRERNRRRKRKNRLRRRVNSVPNIAILEQGKKRPFIASPFIPIATRVAIEPDRRSLSAVVREPVATGYGSVRRVEEARQKKAPEDDESSSGEDEEEEDEDEEEEESTTTPGSVRKASFSSLTSREWAQVIMLALANLCSTVAFSCIAPFYPQEAMLKGMTESQTGIVFGVFELVMFVIAPLFGKHMIAIGSKNMFTFGLGLTGVTAIFFGFLNYLPAGPIFFWLSLLVRCLEAIGDAAFVTSSFAISARCFPGRISVIVGVMETAAGLGFTAGPLIGGFLYEIGGFQLPFLVLGSILIMATILSCFLIDSHNDDPVDENAKGMLGMLKIPAIWMMVFAIIVCSISLAFLDPTLEAHIRSFNLTPTLVGLMFLLCGGVYTVSAPFWGLLIDKFRCTNALMLFGAVATVAAMFLIGPSPFLPFTKSLVTVGLALVILGLAAGALYIPTFQGCLDVVKVHGYEDTFQTYGCVSGIFQSAFSFGGFIGPTLGGLATQTIGFEWTTAILGFITCIFILGFFIFHGCICCKQRIRVRGATSSTSSAAPLHDDERSPLAV